VPKGLSHSKEERAILDSLGCGRLLVGIGGVHIRQTVIPLIPVAVLTTTALAVLWTCSRRAISFRAVFRECFCPSGRTEGGFIRKALATLAFFSLTSCAMILISAWVLSYLDIDLPGQQLNNRSLGGLVLAWNGPIDSSVSPDQQDMAESRRFVDLWQGKATVRSYDWVPRSKQPPRCNVGFAGFQCFGRPYTLPPGLWLCGNSQPGGLALAQTHVEWHTQLDFPLWAPIVLFAGYPLIAFFRGPFRRAARGAKSRCRTCGYELIGNRSGVCPECGSFCPVSGALVEELPEKCNRMGGAETCNAV